MGKRGRGIEENERGRMLGIGIMEELGEGDATQRKHETISIFVRMTCKQ